MTRKAKIWLTSALGFAGYLGIAYSLPRWMSLPDRNAWLLFGLLAILGFGAWLFTAIFLTKRQPAPPPPQDPLSLEMEAAIAQTERRLLDARVARGAVLHKLPAVFVLGPRQHHKTSAVIRSGVHAELLAGDVLRGAQVVPTQTINTWFAGQAIVAELGVDVSQAPERFARFLARFQPARLSNALSSGVQAPRAALVCYSCEALRLPGARDATLIAARELRGTLSTIAQSYGIRLPVYVLFTKADDLPGFKEFARRFTAEEARDVLGATLPMTSEMRAAEYADRASQMYRTELLTLFESLAARRVDVLAREDAAEHRPRAYQFPRELRKLEPLIADFLVELGRPSDLSTSPFVRGFYFSGVREITVSDGGTPAPAIPAPARGVEHEGATALLSALPRPDVAQAMPLQLGSAGRREAQWVFLDRLLAQVVLNDAAALGVTRGGTRISFFRRATLGAAAAAAALLIVALLSAFAANSRLQASVRRHTQDVVNLPTTPLNTPVVAELVVLDSLGKSLDALSDYAWERQPLHLSFGLYQGDTLYGTTHAAYFRQFRRLLFDSTLSTITARLRGMSAARQNDADFASDYARLKAYLIVTDSTTRASDALGGVLLANWPPAERLDTSQRALALRHFERFGRELRRRNPYELSSDPAVIGPAQNALRQASSDKRIYQAIIEKGDDSLPGINFNRDYRVSAGTLSVQHTITGAFTRDGYAFVSKAIQSDLDDYLNLDSWVLGPEAVSGTAKDRVTLERELRAHYDSQFVEQWTTFMRSASVPASGSARDVASRLEMLGSAITRLFAIVNTHTAIADSARVRRYFEPLRLIGAERQDGPPPASIVPYLQQLTGLSALLQNVAQTPAEAQQQHIDQALPKVSEAMTVLTGVLQPLGQRHVDLRIDVLLRSPLTSAQTTLYSLQDRASAAAARAGVAAALRPIEDAGALLCQSFSELNRRRPFAAPGAQWASATELAIVLSPTGALAGLIQNLLGTIVVRQANGFVPNPRANVQLEPAALTFLNGLAKIQEALYPPPETIGPQLEFKIAPVFSQRVRRIWVTFSGQRTEFDRSRPDQVATIKWSLANDQRILIGDPRNLAQSYQVPPEGGWTPLFFFTNGRWTSKGTDQWQFDFDFDQGLEIEFDVEMKPGVQELLRRAQIEPPLVCPTRWVRAAR